MDYKHIGQNIGERRAKLRLPLREVAAMTGLSIGFISNIEHGRVMPTIPSLYAIAAALEVKPATLLRDTSGGAE